jgi:Tfp pilus assembly protein FimT
MKWYFFPGVRMTIRRDGNRSQSPLPLGFTAAELLVVIAIIFTLAAVALPRFIEWSDRQRVKGAARDLVSHFQTARLEAIKRSDDIALVFNPGGPQTGNYTIFVDDGAGGGNPGNLMQESSELVLSRVIMPLGVTLMDTTFTGDRAGYNARGFPVTASFAAAATNGTVSVSNDTVRYDLVLTKTSGLLKLMGPL